MVILGLDISTRTVGYAFVNNQKILDIGFIDISKYETIRNKTFAVFEKISDNKYCDDLDNVYVEDSLSGFARGRTSIQTIIKLAKLNAVLCFIMGDIINSEVKLVNPNTARKRIFGKARQKGKTAKEFVKENLEEIYDLTQLYKITIRGNWDKRNGDALDALVVALYGAQNE
jgi:Holliday junction resolvasome RuvABC endonuclease subunit|tara:strand:- start:6201 stop:6716 length:516 start_codon:yes stop_codon:yes gene_type:complete